MKPYDVENERKSQYKIEKMFLDRWSPRAMSGESLNKEDLMSLFEAVRWSPSSSNEQPWRLLYVLRESKEWNSFFDLLVEFNQAWSVNAGALILIISKQKTENGNDNGTASFDAGASWMSLSLQARAMGLVAHGMAGFDYELARKELNVPEDYKIEAMVAVGKQGDIEDLNERMQKNEKPGAERKRVEEFVREGKFDF